MELRSPSDALTAVRQSKRGAVFLTSAVALLVLVALLGPGVLHSLKTSSEVRNIEPLGTPALDMHATLTSIVQQDFAPYENLATPTFVVRDAHYGTLGESQVASADMMYLNYAQPDGREFRLFTALHGATSIDPATACPKEFTGATVYCKVLSSTGSSMSVAMVLASTKSKLGFWQLTDWQKLTPADYGGVLLERAVRTYHADGRTTTAREEVLGPKALDDSAFAIPLDALTAAATGDALLMAEK